MVGTIQRVELAGDQAFLDITLNDTPPSALSGRRGAPSTSLKFQKPKRQLNPAKTRPDNPGFATMSFIEIQNGPSLEKDGPFTIRTINKGKWRKNTEIREAYYLQNSARRAVRAPAV